MGLLPIRRYPCFRNGPSGVGKRLTRATMISLEKRKDKAVVQGREKNEPLYVHPAPLRLCRTTERGEGGRR